MATRNAAQIIGPVFIPQLMYLTRLTNNGLSLVVALVLTAMLNGCALELSDREHMETEDSSISEQYKGVFYKAKLNIGDSPGLVKRAWGEPDIIKKKNRMGHDVEVWTYTLITTETRYRLVKVLNDKTKRWETREEPYDFFNEYIGKIAKFVDGQLDSWKLYPPAILNPESFKRGKK